jgi:hypothetical protein
MQDPACDVTGNGRITKMNHSEDRGSNPRISTHAVVAQLDRASDYESEGWGFESLRWRHQPVPPPADLAASLRSLLAVVQFHLGAPPDQIIAPSLVEFERPSVGIGAHAPFF